jgi:hypothetical protein
MIIAVYILFFLCQPGAVAADVPVPVSSQTSAAEDEGESIFMGRRYEILVLPKGWKVRPEEATDGSEVLRFFLEDGPEMPNEVFKEENYAAMQLIEVVVTAKRKGMEYKSLHAYRLGRDRKLKNDGVEYSIVDNPNWPTADAFRVTVTKPYAIQEFASQSDENMFRLRAGIDPANIPYTTAVQTVLEGIRKENENSKYFSNKPRLFEFFRNPVHWIEEAVLILVSIVLFLTFNRRARFCALSMLAFSHVGALYGWITSIACWLIGRPEWMGWPWLFITLSLPWLNEAISDWLGGSRLRRVFWWAVFLSLTTGIFSIAGIHIAVEQLHKHWIWQTMGSYSGSLFEYGIIFGVCFGLTHGFPIDPVEFQEEDT